MDSSKDLAQDNHPTSAGDAPNVDRLQGTDGIRRITAVSTDTAVAGLNPLQAFLQFDVITEQFMEQYTYAYCSELPEGSEVVVGWDPRDPKGIFPEAVISGIRKAGCTAVVLGTFPTPGIALYHIWREVPASLAVTASHNTNEYNGLKIFQGATALKLLPDDDRTLTRRVLELDYARDVAGLELRGGRIDAREEALGVLLHFHLDPRNSWLPPGQTLGDFPLIVDTANGAFSGIVAQLVRNIHSGPVFEVNNDVGLGEVNVKGGVADLEGVSEINRDDARFKEHRGVQEVFLHQGRGMVFDGDGDRFFRLEYDAGTDRVLVCSGDQNALLQASYLAAQSESGSLFVTTVESDLNATRAAEALGYQPVLTGVGDKWILHYAVNHPEGFSIGSEESGHTITAGMLTTRSGQPVQVFVGNGLKSAINSFVASRGQQVRETHWPFNHGFKQDFSTYYVRKERFSRSSEVFEQVAKIIEDACDWAKAQRVVFQEDPDMLYVAVGNSTGSPLAAIFVRNSGTEDKIGVHVRGRLEEAATLTTIGTTALVYLASVMKDENHPMVRAEKEIVSALRAGPLSQNELLPSNNVDIERVLLEMANREKVIQATPSGFELTSLGASLLEAWQ